ncbi:MAG: ABC transporter substrate binding protein [Candidatus Dependentiae bacterium]|jgi:ABC-type uncharacterized transport system substrate-binding protein
MKIINTIKNHLKSLLKINKDDSFSTQVDVAGSQLLRWRQSYSKNKQKPIYCVLSHSDNFNEMSAVFDMSMRLQQVLTPDEMPDIVFLPAENSLQIMGQKIIPTLRSGEVGTILTPGVWTTQAISKGFEYNGLPAPLIFSGVLDIKRLDSLAASDKNKSMITGIQKPVIDYQEFVSCIKDTVPHLKRVLLPFDRDIMSEELVRLGYGMNDRQRGQFDNSNIQVIPVPISSHNELENIIEPLLQKGDGVMVTNDTTALAGFDAIKRAAESKRAPIFAENNIAVLRGASIGVGGTGASDGPTMAHMLYRINDGCGEKPGDVPVVTLPRDQEVRFNAEAFARQGIFVSREKMRALNMRSIFAGE